MRKAIKDYLNVKVLLFVELMVVISFLSLAFLPTEEEKGQTLDLENGTYEYCVFDGDGWYVNGEMNIEAPEDDYAFIYRSQQINLPKGTYVACIAYQVEETQPVKTSCVEGDIQAEPIFLNPDEQSVEYEFKVPYYADGMSLDFFFNGNGNMRIQEVVLIKSNHDRLMLYVKIVFVMLLLDLLILVRKSSKKPAKSEK